jgi:hypothetical protein
MRRAVERAVRVPTQLLRARREKRPVDTGAASLAGCADNALMTAPKAPLLRIPRDSIEASVRRLDAECDVVLSIAPLAADRGPSELKHVGYGDPALVRYRTTRGAERQLVFRTMGANWFGHDRRSDRAALALLSADTYDDIPRHIHVLDVGGIHEDGTLTSLRDTGELYLITTYVEGELYAKDLRRVEETRVAKPTDVARAVALASYLVELHTAPFEGPPELYERAVRDLVGSGEGIFGITDSYPSPRPGLPRAPRVHRGALRGVALAPEGEGLAPVPHPRRLSPVQHPLSRGRGLLRARREPRLRGGWGRRRRRAGDQLRVRRGGLSGLVARRPRAAVGCVLDDVPRGARATGCSR